VILYASENHCKLMFWSEL